MSYLPSDNELLLFTPVLLFNYALYTPSGQYIKIFFWGSIRLGEDPTFWQIVAT